MKKNSAKAFIKKHLITLLLGITFIGIIYLAGRSGSCSACSAFTDLFGDH